MQKQQVIRPHIYTLAMITTLVIILAIIWYSIDVFLLIFASILLAIFLNSFSTVLSKKLKISYSTALFLTILFIVSIMALFTVLLIPMISDQVDQLSIEIPKTWDRMTEEVSSYLNWKPLSSITPNFEDWNNKLFIKATNIFSTTFGVIISFVVFLFIGFFFAYNPRVYRDGFLKLIPIHKRDRIAQTLDKITEILRWWLTGKLFSMILVGVLTSLGLWIFGIPLSISLGAIAGLLNFIPNIGPFVSLIPAILIAYGQNLNAIIYVVFLYTGIQILESYLITPIIQQKTISLPPALTIFSQLLMTTLTGFLGLALATPLTAALIVIIRMLYVEDILNDHKHSS